MVKHYCTNKHLNVDKWALVTVAVIFTSMALKVIILKRFLSTRAHTVAIIETNKMDWKTKPYQMKEKYVQAVSKYLLLTNIESVMSSKRGLKGHILWNTHKIRNYDKNIHVIEYYPKFGLQHPHIDCALVIILYSNNLQWQQWEHSNEGNDTILVQHNSSYLSLKHDTQDPVLPLDLILVYWHCLNFFFRLVKTAQYLIRHLYGGQVTTDLWQLNI